MARAYRLNQGTTDTVQSVLLDADTWQHAESLPEPDARASDYVLGLDLGQNAAMSAARASRMAVKTCATFGRPFSAITSGRLGRCCCGPRWRRRESPAIRAVTGSWQSTCKAGAGRTPGTTPAPPPSSAGRPSLRTRKPAGALQGLSHPEVRQRKSPTPHTRGVGLAGARQIH